MSRAQINEHDEELDAPRLLDSPTMQRALAEAFGEEDQS